MLKVSSLPLWSKREASVSYRKNENLGETINIHKEASEDFKLISSVHPNLQDKNAMQKGSINVCMYEMYSFRKFASI